MNGSPLTKHSLNRRQVLKGVGAGAGAAALSAATGPFVHVGRAGQSDFAGTTVTWMSNQRHDRAVKEMLFKEFEEQSGIKVEMQIFADEYNDQLKLAFESGNPPDIFNMTGNLRGQIEAGWPEPADEFLSENPDLAESFLAGAFVPNRGIWNGKIYGLPMYSQTMRLFYNKTLFDRAGLDPEGPPETWTELRQSAKQITDELASEGIFGFILGDKFTWVWWMNAAIPAMGAGAYYYNWKEGRYNFTQDGIKQALQLMIEMKQDDSIFPGIHTLTDDDARQQFALGRAGMIIGGAWNPGVFNDQFESTEDWETAILPVPGSTAEGRFQQTMGDRYTVSATTEKKDAAWEVLKYMYSVPTMTRMYELGMGVMGVEAANTGQSDVRGVPMLAPTGLDLVTPPEPELPTMTPDYQTVMQAIWDEEGANMDEQLAELTENYNAAFDQAVADGKLVKDEFVIPDFDPLTWQPPQQDA
ncbi:MAG TPA: sugar ABC transporter substrate-binding protein [Thermomicrobiales bacterium]|nr:sugar ABC transporter substrate-binding protein [Thermomicrobiales bacterium]